MKDLIQGDLFTNELVKYIDGELLVSSIVIAENIDLLHDSLISSITKYEKELKEFGKLREQDFKESLKISNNKSLLKQRKAFLLNENQAMLLINLSRNTDLVIRFKVNLIKAFSIMKDKLQNKPLSYEELMQNALLIADKKVKELALENKTLNNVIQEQKPKVAFANSVSASNDSILIGAFAKAISTEDFTIGQNRMFDYLRDKGYLISFGASHNLPKQKYIDNGYFEVSQRTINNPNGTIKLVLTTKITGKGQIALYKKLKEEYKLQQIGA